MLALRSHGKKIMTGKREAEVEALDEKMRLAWAQDSAFRFFRNGMRFSVTCCIPWTLQLTRHQPAADRREPRDIVDLVSIHETILPLGAAICAAIGAFTGRWGRV